MKEYELSGKFMQDVMEKVPPEKWDIVLDEMKDALRQFKGFIDVIKAAGEAIEQHPELKFPDTITWRDDNGAGNELHLSAKDEITGEDHDFGSVTWSKENQND